MVWKFHYLPEELLLEKDLWTRATQSFGFYLWRTFVPFSRWLLQYERINLKHDIIAGLTVSAVVIPQAMAYAFLVGLPPQMGLYAVLPAVALGALFGSSQQVITGPVGIVSLLTITVLLPYAGVGTERYIVLASVLALMVGLTQLGLGMFRFGFLVRLIPHSVLIGFSSAASIIIATTQVPPLFGFSITQQPHVFETLVELMKHAHEAQLATFLIGFAALVFIFLVKRRWKSFPVALTAIIAGLLASFFLGFEANGIAVVGTIPASIPSPSFSRFSFSDMLTLAGGGFIIGIIGLVETFAIGKSIATITKQKISSNQEFVGQGVANIGAALFGGLPVSGSFSSTGVNFSAGARTGISALVVALMSALTLLFLTPLFYYLPRTVLAAIVITGVAQLIEPERFRKAFYISKTDGTVAITVFIISFLLKPDDAVLIGVILALVLFFQRIMWARVHEEGFDHEWGDILRRAGTKPDGLIETYPQMIIARIDMSIFYANVEYVVHQLQALYDKRVATGENVKVLVLNFQGVNYVDLTALEALGEFLSGLREKGTCIHTIYAKNDIIKVFRKGHDVVGPIHFTHNTDELKRSYEKEIHS